MSAIRDPAAIYGGMMTVQQAAGRIGISASKLYQLVAGRQIGHYRVGGRILFSDEDVASFIARCRVGVIAGAPPAPDRSLLPRLKHLRIG